MVSKRVQILNKYLMILSLVMEVKRQIKLKIRYLIDKNRVASAQFLAVKFSGNYLISNTLSERIYNKSLKNLLDGQKSFKPSQDWSNVGDF